MPPTIIYDAKKVNPAWTTGEIPGTMYGNSDKGWITTELFESWLKDHFIKHAVGSRPLLLLLDGHSTHNQPDVIRLARKNDIIILCLPPHATHEAQPLDCAVFSPLKAQWQKVVHDFIQSNPGEVVNFNTLFAKAWIASLTAANLIAGFRTCGIYPFNRLAIKIPGEGSRNDNLSSTTSTIYNADDSTESSSDVITEDNAAPLVVPEPFTPEQDLTRFNNIAAGGWLLTRNYDINTQVIMCCRYQILYYLYFRMIQPYIIFINVYIISFFEASFK